MKTIFCGTYIIRNKINGKIYVGSAKDIYARWSGHLQDLNGNRHNKFLQEDWNKFGEDNFEFIVWDLHEEKHLVRYEQAWMDYFLSWKREYGYNINPVAGRPPILIGEKNPNFGKPVPEERKEKQRIAMKGKMSGCKNPMFGKSEKLSPNFGRKMSEEQKKISGDKQRGELSKNHKLNWDLVKEIRRLYNEEGWSLSELGKKFRVNGTGTILPLIQNNTWHDDNYVYVRYGNVSRTKKGEEHPMCKLSDAQRKEIIEEYRNNLVSCEDISKKYSVSSQTIKKIIRKNFSKEFIKEKTLKIFSKQRFGRKLSKEHKKKISEAQSGENSNNSILTLEQVREIREKYLTGEYTQKNLGEMYGVTRSAIEHIVLNKNWRI